MTVCMAFIANAVLGQDVERITQLIKTTESRITQMPAEKLYLQFDKPYYNIADTVWFKAYLLNAADRYASAISTKLYVELINDSSRVVKRLVIPMQNGLGNGDMAFYDAMPRGTYHIRAYTNWMQNFGTGLFFTRQFSIGAQPAADALLISEQHKLTSTAAGSKLNLRLSLQSLKNLPVPYHDVELKLTGADKSISTAVKTTNDAGIIEQDFVIGASTDKKSLKLIVTDKANKVKYTLPVPSYADGKDIDLQFFPEGGVFVTGLYNKVAFKAINTSGYGENIEGNIKNSKNEIVASIKALHNGMGSFMLLPQPGEKYHASILVANAKALDVDLPQPKLNGIALRVDNLSKADTISLYITANTDSATLRKSYALIAQAKDRMLFGVPVNLSNGFYNVKIPKSKFATGIVAFTLINEANKPLNERRVFVNNNDNLTIRATYNQPSYQPLDSVAIKISVKDANGKPIQGSFSATVTDDSVIEHNENANNIKSNFLITSEIRGYVENPGWYLLNNDVTRAKALDNLLLTQGWSGYDWENNASAEPAFMAEKDNIISGRLRSSFFKKPLVNAAVSLLSVHPKTGLMRIDTVTNSEGRFTFTDLPLIDTMAYTIKARNGKGKSLVANIEVDKFIPAETKLLEMPVILPWFAQKNDDILTKYFQKTRKNEIKGLAPGEAKGTILKQVTIKALKKPVLINDELAYPRQEITEKSLIEAGSTTLLDLLHQKLNGFKEGSIYSLNKTTKVVRQPEINFCIYSNLIVDVIIDGISVIATNGPRTTGRTDSYNEFLRLFFNYVTAAEVKNIQLIDGMRYYLIIKTRSGSGPFLKITPGMLSYRPIPMAFPHQFYKPRYEANTTLSNITDDRSTITWEPNIITDADGNASFSFYAATKPSTYTLVLEGMDIQGGVGFISEKIKVQIKGQPGRSSNTGK